MKPGIPKSSSGKGGSLMKEAILNQVAEAETGELGGTTLNVREDISTSRQGSSSSLSYGFIPEDEAVGDDMAEKRAAPLPAVARSGSGAVNEKYAPLSWDAYFSESVDVKIPGTENVFHIYTAGTEGPVIFCIHGGGYSGLSFAVTASKMASKVRVVALDVRGHGQTRTDNDCDLSAETLCKDVVDVINALYHDDPPPIVLVGHSMGGAVAVRVAAMRALPTLAGLVVIDVVEGTAMASLQFMQTVLENRPTSFTSPHKAVEWSIRNGSIRNLESARVSIPSILRMEAPDRYTWIAKLEESEQYWRGWYDGLSDTFNSCPCPKLLLLAGTDRLDRPLTIAQMQGKFQMTVFRHAGHAIHEDEPTEFADSLLHFITHNRIGSAGPMIPGLRRPVSLHH